MLLWPSYSIDLLQFILDFLQSALEGGRQNL